MAWYDSGVMGSLIGVGKNAVSGAVGSWTGTSQGTETKAALNATLTSAGAGFYKNGEIQKGTTDQAASGTISAALPLLGLGLLAFFLMRKK